MVQMIRLLKEKYAVENEINREIYRKSHAYRKTRMSYKDSYGIVRAGEKTPINNLTQWC